jgi:hypothetical protein
MNASQNSFDLRRSPTGLSPSVVASDGSPEKGMSFQHALRGAEKRVTYRGLLMRHLSVVSRDSEKTAGLMRMQ